MTVCADWITDEDVTACYTIPDGFATATILTQASELAYVLSGRQFPGECEYTVRPCGVTESSSPMMWGDYPSIPFRDAGVWMNGWCGCHWSNCGCSGYPNLDLGRGDIVTVTEVVVNGVALGADDWRLDSGRFLARLDGGSWPCCQNMRVNSGAGYFAVTYTAGRTPPTAGVRAAAALAAELIRACVGDGDCRLKPNVQSIARQGVSATFIDPALFITQGITGIWEMDEFVVAYNPLNLRRQARVWSPDQPHLIVS